jgi:ribosomal protein S18 acetylase RimI-like enzyme
MFMIVPMKEKDYKKAAQLMHSLNQDPEYYSGFCSSSLIAIEKDLKDASNEGTLLALYQNQDLLGVLMLVKRPNQELDCIGPYCLNGDLDHAKELLRYGLKNQTSQHIHFFFDESSSYYKSLMTDIQAEVQDIEYIMKCFDYKAIKHEKEDHQLVRPKVEEQSKVQQLYEDIFKETYLPSSTFVDKDHYPQIYLCKQGEDTIGIALLKEQNESGYLEFFGINPNFRGMGWSKVFLDALLRDALMDKKLKYVVLVVDEVNSIASNLYMKQGFSIEKRNVSYCFHTKKEEK